MTKDEARVFDVLIIGAGFAGLYALHKLRGEGFDVRLVEAGSGVGGTWYWNRYPGARCDTESMQYSYSFDDDLEQEWVWTERFPAQPEILRYLNHVADRFDLRRDIDLDTRITSVDLGEDGIWNLVSENGKRYRTRFCITAVGCLASAPLTMEFEGQSNFSGEIYYTANWPHRPVDLKGKRVAVIGTGSSGIQFIPEAARGCSELYVFQRTPNYSVPARNTSMPEGHARSWKEHYPELREKARFSRSGTLYDFGTQSALEVDPETREKIYQERWETGTANFTVSFNDLVVNEAANETAADFVRRQIRKTVKDPVVAEALTPRDYPIFTKRICLDSGYFETFNRDNVKLVNLRDEPISHISPTGIETTGGSYDVDVIVFATGFDALTGPLLRLNIRGEGGVSLADKWAEGPRAYLGLMIAGFPNLLTITGPGSPSVLGNMVVAVEQHVEWIAALLSFMRERGLTQVRADLEHENTWVEHIAQVAEGTLYPRAASWYMGANVPGKPRLFIPYIGGYGRYREICAEVASDGYRGFLMQHEPGRVS